MDRRKFLNVIAKLGVVGLVASYPFFIERYIVLINRYRIPVPNLPQAFQGFTMVQLTDFHYGPLMPLGFLKWIIKRANRIPRDITICTGDYINHRQGRDAISDINAIWPELAGLTAPSGVYSILGNHDQWGSGDRSLYWLEKTGQNLRFKKKRLIRNNQTLWLVGVGDLWTEHRDLDETLSDIPDHDCRIVLAHNPETADTRFTSPVHLMVSGHTHGGQVNVPFYGPPMLPVSNEAYASGLAKSKAGFPVFISKGIGWAILPVRFNCLPEIAVLELVRSEEKPS